MIDIPTSVYVALIALVGAPLGAASTWLLSRNRRHVETESTTVAASRDAVEALRKALEVALEEVDRLRARIDDED